MEDLILSPLSFHPRFTHINEKIFDLLDNTTLNNCRKATKSCKCFIDSMNLPWVRIVDIPKIPKNGNTYLHVAAKTGQLEKFKMVFNAETKENPGNIIDKRPFLIVCQYGHFKIMKVLLQESKKVGLEYVF